MLYFNLRSQLSEELPVNQQIPIPMIIGPLTSEIIRAFNIIGQCYARNEPIPPYWLNILFNSEGYLKSLEPFLVTLTKQNGPMFYLDALKKLQGVPRTTAVATHAEEFCLTAAGILGIANSIWIHAAEPILQKHAAALQEEIAKKITADLERVRTQGPRPDQSQPKTP